MCRREEEQKLDPGEIAQIAEFGQNPIQLFDEPHKQFKEKMKKSLMDFENDELQIRYRCYHSDVVMIRMVTNKKNILCSVADHELYKLSSTPSKYKIQSKLKIHSYYPILCKGVFSADPQSTFAYAGDYLATCRHPDKCFILYNLSTLTRAQCVAFHLVIELSNM